MSLIKNMRVEYKSSPLGMDETAPRFSYQFTENVIQSSCRIQVRSEKEGTVWDSGAINDGDSCQIVYAGAPLSPFTRYFWKVYAAVNTGEVIESEESFFETGFLNTPWQAKWIGTYAGAGNKRPAQVLIRRFELEEKKNVRLAITALGLYSAEINGRKISNDLFTPGWTDYFTRVQYQVYDVTSLLKPGKNELKVTLGEGWYCGRISRMWNSDQPSWGEHPMLLAELRSGEETLLITDEKWEGYDSQCRFSDIYDGELFDASLSIDTGEGKGIPILTFTPDIRIDWQSGAPIREMLTLKPQKISRRENGVIVVDFGQNFTGRERIRLIDPGKGAVISIRHGEMLQDDGTLYTANLRSAQATTTYITGGNEVEFYEPGFTFYGFRYLEISGLNGEFEVEGAVIYSDLEQTGSFSCSNHMINQLFSNIIWGQRSNFLDVPTDCPQRDEKHGWTGDTQVFANAGSYNMDASAFYTKWLEDLNCSRIGDVFPHIAPRCKYREADGTPLKPFIATGWGDAGIVVPWQMYRKYGDVRILGKYLGNMAKHLDFQVRECDGSLLVTDQKWGDWLNIDDPTDRCLLGTAYLAGMNRLLSQIAGICGKEKLAAERLILYEEIKKAFIGKFFNAEGMFTGTSQTSKVMALHFDLYPDDRDLRGVLIEDLVRDIEKKHQGHLSTGFLGTPLLLPVLTKVEALDTAYKLLLQSSYPSWLYPVTQGATTMWERWNSWTKDTGFGDVMMNSFNHYAYGAVADWFYETICGIQPDPTFRKFRIAPRFGRFLDHAEAEYDSIYGKIISKWRRNGDDYVMEFTIPPNTEADVRGEVLGPGSYVRNISRYE